MQSSWLVNISMFFYPLEFAAEACMQDSWHIKRKKKGLAEVAK